MATAAAILEPHGLRVPRCYANWDSVLAIEYIAEQWTSDHVGPALDYLRRLHALPVPQGLQNHYHGLALAGRLDWELDSIRHAPASFFLRDYALHLSAGVRALPHLSPDQLSAARCAPGHGDFYWANLRVERDGTAVHVVPIDWIDFGCCDPRYELAHFLDTVPDRARSHDLAWQHYWTHVDRPSEDYRRRFITEGQAINSLLALGNLARRPQADEKEAAEGTGMPQVGWCVPCGSGPLVNLSRDAGGVPTSR